MMHLFLQVPAVERIGKKFATVWRAPGLPGFLRSLLSLIVHTVVGVQ
jgi:hypothetical protein